MDVSPIDELVIQKYNENVASIKAEKKQEMKRQKKNRPTPKQPIPKNLPPLKKFDNNLPDPKLSNLNKRQEAQEYIPTNQSDNSQNRDSKVSKKSKKSKKHTDEEIQEGNTLGQYQISKV